MTAPSLFISLDGQNSPVVPSDCFEVPSWASADPFEAVSFPLSVEEDYGAQVEVHPVGCDLILVGR